MLKRILYALLLGMLVATPGFAATEQAADDYLLFAPVPNVVTPGRREINVNQSPNAISVITRSEIKYSPCRTIVELLQYVVGMDTYRKTLTQSCAIARGQVFDEAPQMVVMLDGQPINVAPYSGMQWNTIPVTLDEIERIEVVRGPASAVYGADALLGVINIITLPVKDRRSSLRASVGEKGTQEINLQAAQMLTPDFGLALTLGYAQSQGKGEAEAPAAKQFIPNWDIKDWSEVQDLGYRLDYRADKLSLLSETGYTADSEGYNPSPGDPAIDWSQKQTLASSNKISFAIDQDELSLNIGARNLWQKNLKWSGALNDYVYKYTIQKGLGVDSALQYILRRLPFNTLTLGMNFDYLNSSREIQNPVPYVYDAVDRLLGGYLQDQVSLLDDNLLITLGGRVDKWTSLDSVFSPMAAINYLLLDKTLAIRAFAGSSFHRPDFDSQYYYVDLSSIGPNSWFKGTQLTLTTADGQVVNGTNLRPSTNVTYETGVRWDPDPTFSTNLTAYFQTIKDLSSLYSIYSNFDPGAGPVGLDLSYQNTKGRIEQEGLEFEISKSFNNQIKIWANWSGQMGQSIADDGTRTAWEAMPRNKIAGGIVFTGPVNVDLRGRFVTDVSFNEVGAPANHVAAYKTVDVSVFKEFENLMVKLAVTDLFNDVHYEYPLYTQMVRKAMLTVQYYF